MNLTGYLDFRCEDISSTILTDGLGWASINLMILCDNKIGYILCSYYTTDFGIFQIENAYNTRPLK